MIAYVVFMDRITSRPWVSEFKGTIFTGAYIENIITVVMINTT